MINFCENARRCFHAYLLQQKLKPKKVQVEVKVSVDILNQEVEILQKGIKIAEHSVTEGDEELAEIMRSKTINSYKLLGCQSKTNMGVKRKAESSSDMKEIGVKKKTLPD